MTSNRLLATTEYRVESTPTTNCAESSHPKKSTFKSSNGHCSIDCHVERTHVIIAAISEAKLTNRAT
jgi:hypothetical protein